MRIILLAAMITACRLHISYEENRYDTGYVEGEYDWYDIHDGSEPASTTPYEQIDIDLDIGYVSSSGLFNESNPYLYLDPSGDWAFIQGAVFLDNLSQYNVDLIRVAFTSNRVEWVCAQPSGTWIFLTQEACQQAGFYCDPIVAGESVSGYFDAGAGQMMAVTNAHCSSAGLPYTYTIEAAAYDIAGVEPVRISETVYANINCREE